MQTFLSASILLSLLLGSSMATPLPVTLVDESSMSNTTLSERQTQCIWSSYTELVGDSNPHQKFLNKQLTDSIDCASANQCGVEKGSAYSYSIGFSVEGTLEEWLSGGFSVESSWETSTSESCTGITGQNVCIWKRIAYTSYTVQNYQQNSCTGSQKIGGPTIVTSPNKGNVGGHDYCVVGTCRSAGESYWEDGNEPAGGPGTQ